jgi:hypothetical protein
MADYYPLIARAVAGLEHNTGEARRALYDRARTALLNQLRSAQPALEEADIHRERLALETAIRKVETEAAQRSRAEGAPAAPTGGREGAAPSAPAAPAAPRAPAGAAAEPQTGGQPATPPAKPRSSLLTDQALKGFREVVGPKGEPDTAPADMKAAAKAPPAIKADGAKADFGKPEPGKPEPGKTEARKPAGPVPPPAARPQPPSGRSRDPLAGIPAAHDFDRLEPEIGADALYGRSEPRTEGQPFPPYGATASGAPSRRPLQPPPADEEGETKRARSPIGTIVKSVIALIIVIAIAGGVVWQWGTVKNLYHAFRGSPSATVARDAGTAARPKISDRIGAAGPTTTAPTQTAPAVAQRVVLYEEDPADPQGKRYVGSAIWRTETVSSQGQPPETAVRADVEIPERHMTMTFSIRRNTDKTLPASHTIEVMFNLPADFSGGGIANVPGVLMKQEEQARGTPLAGLAVQVTTGYFLIGLSAADADFQRNLELLKDRSWFDIPIVYKNGRRAILAIEKGTPGERAFAEAFAAWKQ